MRQALQFTNTVTNVALGSLVINALLAVLCFIFFIRLNEIKPAKETCASFSSYGAALQAYNAGNKHLDGGKKNGVPCQNLL